MDIVDNKLGFLRQQQAALAQYWLCYAQGSGSQERPAPADSWLVRDIKVSISQRK